MDTKYGSAMLSVNSKTWNIIAFVWKLGITTTEQHDAYQRFFVTYTVHDKW